MMTIHPVLLAVKANLEAEMATVVTNLRVRGGKVRGTDWLEMAGRSTTGDGAYYEARFHIMADGTAKGGILGYQPLSKGGRTIVVGEITISPDEQSYRTCNVLVDPRKHIGPRLVTEASRWIAQIRQS